MTHYLLAIDQGTTSTRAIVFDEQGHICSQAQQEFTQYFPEDGWVEHDAEEIWQTTLVTCRQAIQQAGISPQQVLAIGITNQRETTLIWDRVTGELLHPAIVWQDRRTAAYCAERNTAAVASQVSQKTGLLLDPYFSASKIAWVLQHVPGAKARAARGELAFGTIDTFLLWRLTGGREHRTDATNAARTLLFNIHTGQWDPELLQLFDIPEALLPEVMPNSCEFGTSNAELLGAAIPITGMAGDQQAATFGQACFKAGMMKSTYGTGCFMVLNTGKQAVQSQHRLLTTIAYRLGDEITYALEGSIFVAGAAVQWLRDALHLIQKASDTQSLAEAVPDNQGVYLVPAFTGLGAPYWDPHARGAILGLTRDTGVKQIARAALEAVCYQTCDLLRAMQADYHGDIQEMRVDGGMVANNWLMQFLADILHLPLSRPQVTESSALGAALLAGLHSGCFNSLAQISELWKIQQRFMPCMPDAKRQQLYAGWQQAVQRICHSPITM